MILDFINYLVANRAAPGADTNEENFWELNGVVKRADNT